MKNPKLNSLFILFIFIFLSPKQLSGQDRGRDSLLIYHEVLVSMAYLGSFDPYYAFTKDPDKKNHPIYKRFFAFYHETLIEKARNKLTPNFIHNKENVFVIPSSDLVDPIRSKIVFILPDDYEEPWQFHNEKSIIADDLITSIKYAICKGLLSDKIFKNNLITKEGNYKFSISFYQEFNLEMILRYLEKVYVIPHDYFASYVIDEECANNYYEFLQERPHNIAAGPFQCDDCEGLRGITSLKRNPRYPKRPFVSGIKIKKQDLTADHFGKLVKGDTNIDLDIPPGTIQGIRENHVVNRIEGWKVKTLFFDHSNPIFQDIEFRKIISKIINPRALIRNKLGNDANLVTGPYTTVNTSNDPTVGEYLTKAELKAGFYDIGTMREDYVESIKNKIENINNFSYGGRNGEELQYNNQKLEIFFGYSKRIMTEYERDALLAIIDNLKRIGISIPNPIDYNDQDFIQAKLMTDRWDIIYDEIEIQQNESAAEYFQTANGENSNYHKYSNPELDKLFKDEQVTLDPGKLNNIKRKIHQILHDDYAAIFLWTMYNYYAFDSDYISSRNDRRINSINFFTSPEKWKMVRDED